MVSRLFFPGTVSETTHFIRRIGTIILPHGKISIVHLLLGIQYYATGIQSHYMIPAFNLSYHSLVDFSGW